MAGKTFAITFGDNDIYRSGKDILPKALKSWSLSLCLSVSESRLKFSQGVKATVA